jgi:hypothetical protein
MSAELLSRLSSAARATLPLVVVLADGSRVAGRVRETAITFATVRGLDGSDRRVVLGDVVEVLGRDGRRVWPPTSTGATP